LRTGLRCQFEKKIEGNRTLYRLSEGTEIVALEVRHTGTVGISKGTPEVALANTGNWSGGCNAEGVVLMKAGDVIRLSCKGSNRYLVCDGTTITSQKTLNF
jgi:hypothetical protein